MNLQNPEVLRQKAEVEVKRKQPLRVRHMLYKVVSLVELLRVIRYHFGFT